MRSDTSWVSLPFLLLLEDVEFRADFARGAALIDLEEGDGFLTSLTLILEVGFCGGMVSLPACLRGSIEHHPSSLFATGLASCGYAPPCAF